MNPIKFHKLIVTKIPKFELGISIYFKDKSNKQRFLNVFKESNFRLKERLENFEEDKRENQPTKTTFTGVITGIPTNTNINELKQHLKAKIPITNLTRIRGDKGRLYDTIDTFVH